VASYQGLLTYFGLSSFGEGSPFKWPTSSEASPRDSRDRACPEVFCSTSTLLSSPWTYKTVKVWKTEAQWGYSRLSVPLVTTSEDLWGSGTNCK
jgi:hypothetical protein